jgi:polyisoprenoid-binding protein YceI
MATSSGIGVEHSVAIVAKPAQHAPERWEIDEGTSRLSFALHHLVVKIIQGEFERWGGTLFLDRRQPSLSSIRVWIELDSVDTDSPERDAHVRLAEFFDVAQFPLAVFNSTNVTVTEGPVVVNGRLDLHGVIHDVELTISPIAMPTSASTDQRRTFSVQARIDRQTFGLHWNQDLETGGIVVGDHVEVEAHVDVVRSADAAGTGNGGQSTLLMTVAR